MKLKEAPKLKEFMNTEEKIRLTKRRTQNESNTKTKREKDLPKNIN